MTGTKNLRLAFRRHPNEAVPVYTLTGNTRRHAQDARLAPEEPSASGRNGGNRTLDELRMREP